MKIKYLDYILDSIIKEFLDLEYIKEFKDRYSDYKHDGFENSIKDWSSNKTRKEISICRIIDFIEEKNMKNRQIATADTTDTTIKKE